MARNGVKQRWPETWKGIVPRTSPAPTSFARSHSNVSIFGTSTTARECTIDLSVNRVTIRCEFRNALLLGAGKGGFRRPTTKDAWTRTSV